MSPLAGLPAEGDQPRPLTLGAVLDAQARRMLDRMVPRIAWAGVVQPVLERAASQSSTPNRFERLDGDVGDAGQLRRPQHHRYVAQAALPAVPRPVLATVPLSVPAPASPNAHHAVPSTPAADARHTGTQELPPTVRGRLREELGPAADVAQVRTDDRADEITRAHGADAVTVGSQIHFRRGRFRPYDDQGFALLTHEARHVVALLRPAEVSQRADRSGRIREETRARAAATRALLGRRGPTAETASPASGATLPRIRSSDRPAPPQAGAAPGPAQMPMAAPAADRSPSDSEARDAVPRAELDVAQLKRDLMAELVHRLRSEFERGG